MKERYVDQIVGASLILGLGLILSVVLYFTLEVPFLFTGLVLLIVEVLYLIIIIIKNFNKLDSNK